GRVAEAEVLERVQELRRAAQPHLPVCLEDDVAQLLLPHGLVPEAELLRNDGVEDHAPDGRLLPLAAPPLTALLAVHGLALDPEPARRVVLDVTERDRGLRLGEAAVARSVLVDLGQPLLELLAPLLRQLRLRQRILQ